MLKGIINKVAAEHSIDPELLVDAYKDSLIQIKDTVRRPELPKVLINGFGTFKVKPERLDYVMKNHIKRYLNSSITKSELKEILEPLFKVRRRFKDEQRRKKNK